MSDKSGIFCDGGRAWNEKKRKLDFVSLRFSSVKMFAQVLGVTCRWWLPNVCAQSSSNLIPKSQPRVEIQELSFRSFAAETAYDSSFRNLYQKFSKNKTNERYTVRRYRRLEARGRRNACLHCYSIWYPRLNFSLLGKASLRAAASYSESQKFRPVFGIYLSPGGMFQISSEIRRSKRHSFRASNWGVNLRATEILSSSFASF